MDKGALSYIMSMSCWKAIGSPQLTQSPTTLKSFDRRTYNPYGILNSLQVELEGKIVSIEVEVIYEPLDYNLLLGHAWFYAMASFISTYFCMIAFPHKCRIMAINQPIFFTIDSHVTGSAPLVGETLHSYQHVGVGLLKDSSPMGTFLVPPPPLHNKSYLVSYINMILASIF